MSFHLRLAKVGEIPVTCCGFLDDYSYSLSIKQPTPTAKRGKSVNASLYNIDLPF